jgi:hypothetical protein
MDNVANCSFANVICAGKVLVRGPRTSPVQKDSQSLCSKNDMHMIMFCLAIEAQYLSNKMLKAGLLMRKVCLNWAASSGAVSAQCVPSHLTLSVPRIHRMGSHLRRGKMGRGGENSSVCHV